MRPSSDGNARNGSYVKYILGCATVGEINMRIAQFLYHRQGDVISEKIKNLMQNEKTMEEVSLLDPLAQFLYCLLAPYWDEIDSWFLKFGESIVQMIHHFMFTDAELVNMTVLLQESPGTEQRFPFAPRVSVSFKRVIQMLEDALRNARKEEDIQKILYLFSRIFGVTLGLSIGHHDLQSRKASFKVGNNKYDAIIKKVFVCGRWVRIFAVDCPLDSLKNKECTSTKEKFFGNFREVDGRPILGVTNPPRVGRKQGGVEQFDTFADLYCKTRRCLSPLPPLPPLPPFSPRRPHRMLRLLRMDACEADDDTSEGADASDDKKKRKKPDDSNRCRPSKSCRIAIFRVSIPSPKSGISTLTQTLSNCPSEPKTGRQYLFYGSKWGKRQSKE
jgi:hypothetical protein